MAKLRLQYQKNVNTAKFSVYSHKSGTIRQKDREGVRAVDDQP